MILPNKSMIEKGFTLIELMITVVIIGILSSIAFAQYSQYIMRSQAFEVYSAELIVKKALEVGSQNNNGAYTSNITLPTAFSQLHFITNADCQTDGQEYTCTLTSATNRGVNEKLVGSSYTFNSGGNRGTLSTGSTGWPISNNCYVTSSGGC